VDEKKEAAKVVDSPLPSSSESTGGKVAAGATIAAGKADVAKEGAVPATGEGGPPSAFSSGASMPLLPALPVSSLSSIQSVVGTFPQS
jgi:hypothetical protein